MKKNLLLTGTLLLTGAGLLSRFIGFFYRIFLSRMFGEEGMGIYSLTGPVLALTYALCTSGIQNAISRFVAAQSGSSAKRSRLHILLTGLIFSGLLSLACSFFLYQYADFIAARLLMEERCAPLLRIIALSIPAACVHSCLNGYYYGIRQTAMPALCQLTEQIFRVGSVFCFWQYAKNTGVSLSVTIAAVGLVIGEFASALLALLLAWRHFHRGPLPARLKPGSFTALQMLFFALPLSANRVCLNLLSAAESSWLPVMLEHFGYSPSQALSIYGVYTGMAMTCILFPGAITNSVSVLLMPMVAAAEAGSNHTAIKKAVLQCIRFCLLLGFICMTGFFLFGGLAGRLLFHSQLAGRYIQILSLVCPFLYLNTTLSSVLNGLDKTSFTFVCNLAAVTIRLAFVFFAVPLFGMKGYFWGIFTSQLFLTLSSCYALRCYICPCTSKYSDL